MTDRLIVSSQHHYGVTDATLSTPLWVMALRDDFGLSPSMFVNNIEKYRLARKWSRPELAKHVVPPTSPQQIERLEKGQRRITLEWVERIAKALDIEPYWLITNEVPTKAVDKTLNEQVADEVARTLARIALGGIEPPESTVTTLSIMLRELIATFATHPDTMHDPDMLRPAIDVLARRSSPK